MAQVSFGQFFKERRIATGQTLRSFCHSNNFEPSNVSKLERDRLTAPQSNDVLHRYALALHIEEGTPEWQEFFDLAHASNGMLPPEVLNDEEVVSRLPVLFRSLRGETISEEQFENLIEIIRRA